MTIHLAKQQKIWSPYIGNWTQLFNVIPGNSISFLFYFLRFFEMDTTPFLATIQIVEAEVVYKDPTSVRN